MIRPNVRASFGRREAEILVSLAGAGGEERLRERGIDALLEREIHDRQLADYTAGVLLEFGRIGRGSPGESAMLPQTLYLADILQELERARGEREFLLRAHLGNLALWLGGIFPDYIAERVQRRGAPPLSYYDELGATGFRSAAHMDLAMRHGVGDLFLQFADQFTSVRSALNGLSDMLFFPNPGNPVERVLREVSDRFHRQLGG